MLLIQSLVAWKEWKNPGRTRLILGLITSLVAPCLLVNDISHFFLVNGILGNVLNLAITWTLYGLIRLKSLDEFLHSTIFECHTPSNDVHMTSTLRCPSLDVIDSSDCYPGVFSFTENDFVTLCPDNFDRWKINLIFTIVATVAHVLSILGIIFMSYLRHRVRRMRLVKLFCCGCCNTCNMWLSKDMFMYDIVNDLKDGMPFGEVNKKATENIGQPLLILSIQSGFLGFTKVSFK